MKRHGPSLPHQYQQVGDDWHAGWDTNFHLSLAFIEAADQVLINNVFRIALSTKYGTASGMGTVQPSGHTHTPDVCPDGASLHSPASRWRVPACTQLTCARSGTRAVPSARGRRWLRLRGCAKKSPGAGPYARASGLLAMIASAGTAGSAPCVISRPLPCAVMPYDYDVTLLQSSFSNRASPAPGAPTDFALQKSDNMGKKCIYIGRPRWHSTPRKAAELQQQGLVGWSVSWCRCPGVVA